MDSSKAPRTVLKRRWLTMSELSEILDNDNESFATIWVNKKV